jgi:hypothetical protein
MRKSELTAEQVKTAEVLLRALAQAGWEMDGWDARFDRGFDVYPELEARFGNERGTLCLTFDPQGDHVSLLAASERFEEVVEFRVFYCNRDHLARILHVVVNAQHRVSIESYTGLIRELFVVSDEIFWEIQGQQEKRVSEEDLAQDRFVRPIPLL